MSIDVWLAFVLAATGLILIPGPTMLLMIGFAISSGVRPALASMAGVVLADMTAMTVSAAGLGAVLAASATLFVAMKWVGAAYLVYLGIRLWRAPPVVPGAETEAGTGPGAETPTATAAATVPRGAPVLGMIGKAYTVTVLNPKAILFFTAFMPQFVDTARPLLPQLLVLGATFAVLALGIMTAYVLMSGRVRVLFRTPWAMRLFNRLGGTLLIGAGVLTASLKRG